MTRGIILFLALISCSAGITQPTLQYTFTAGIGDTTNFYISLRVSGAPSTFRIAFAQHPEYDEHTWRSVHDMRADGGAAIRRTDSAIWQVDRADHEVTIHYAISLPKDPGSRGAWQQFLSSYGGLGGGMYSFIYLPDFAQSRAWVKFNFPKDWTIGTQLNRDGSGVYVVRNAEELLDAQVIFGRLHEWTYESGGKPHLVHWLAPPLSMIDSASLIGGLKRISDQLVTLFGKLPYDRYDFLLSDRSYGGLEHRNSVAASADAAEFKDRPEDFFAETTHEYLHSWNEVRIKPAEWPGPVTGATPLAPTLWWLEGATMYYMDLLIRRAGLPAEEADRLQHLGGYMAQYFSNPAYTHFTAEEISRAANGPEEMMGDYSASTHLQGELTVSILDLLIREKTQGKKTMDDVMRALMNDFGGGKPFHSADVRNVILRATGADVAAPFDRMVFSRSGIDFGPFMQEAGLSFQAKDDSVEHVDTRIFLFHRSGEQAWRLKVNDPGSCWAVAGLHTCDVILAVNGAEPTGNRALFRQMRQLKAGDSVLVTFLRNGKREQRSVRIGTYNDTRVTVSVAKPSAWLDAWLAGR